MVERPLWSPSSGRVQDPRLHLAIPHKILKTQNLSSTALFRVELGRRSVDSRQVSADPQRVKKHGTCSGREPIRTQTQACSIQVIILELPSFLWKFALFGGNHAKILGRSSMNNTRSDRPPTDHLFGARRRGEKAICYRCQSPRRPARHILNGWPFPILR